MKNKILLLAIGLLLPIVASAQLITSAQTITVKEKRPEKPLHYEQSIEFTAATDFQDKGGDRSVYGLEYIGGIRFNYNRQNDLCNFVKRNVQKSNFS